MMESGTGQLTYNNFNYVFQYKDHLGNIRLSYSDTNKDLAIEQSEIIEESHYYPFGLKHRGYNNNITGGGNYLAQQWKFGGKQLNTELDIAWYDFGSRNYDPALGRWFNTYPQNQFDSPYTYSFNNPVLYTDPDGEFAFILMGAVVGGMINGMINDYNGGDFWQGFAVGSISSVAGAVGCRSFN